MYPNLINKFFYIVIQKKKILYIVLIDILINLVVKVSIYIIFKLIFLYIYFEIVVQFFKLMSN